MLLAIDAGNTNTVLAVFRDGALMCQWRISANNKRTGDEYFLFLDRFLDSNGFSKNDINDVIISSVVPQNIFSLKTLSRKHLNTEPLIIGEDEVFLGIDIKLDKPSEVGADRLVNSIAAYEKFGGNLVIIDFGTATTFDVVGSGGEYLGGAISPGINLSIEALHNAAAKLPSIDISRPKKVIGDSTESAMQSGIYWGYVGLIEGIVTRIEKEYAKPMKVICTGGLAPLFYDVIDKIEFLEPDLTIEGLNLIYKKNSVNNDSKLKKA
ncbi:MAG: type III pantothenate kinase [Rickettsiales bacterium]|nr:type III pantothenate kinase [Pseudomonadota bacterium]MDA0966675.1 type III pantothenate kinase [Pseudomonadota bacterium]MDG4543703.1 type III pantothenate kinase [Rickettsiales bacterium]MDG4545850.1 type III pantothenate kinase [Rickettsiales bacterium]MDG4547376.1 type III pantothenate kinase [Rickettsiales bacterium]